MLDEASHKYDPKILGWGMGFSNAKPQNELEPLDGFFNHAVALGALLGAVVNCIGALRAVRAGLENLTPENQSHGPYVKYNSS